MNSEDSVKKKIVQMGIWLDYNKADIITIDGRDSTIVSIPSGIDPGKPKGGHRSKTPYGPMDVMSEKKHLEKRKHQLNAYYKLICNRVMDCDEFFIMGPAEAKIGLRNYLSKYRKVYKRLQDVQTVDSLTENQKVEKVKNFFKS